MSVFSAKVQQHAIAAVRNNVLGNTCSLELANCAIAVQQRYQLSNEELREYYDAFVMLCSEGSEVITADSLCAFYEKSEIDLSSTDCSTALSLFSNNDTATAITFKGFVDRMRAFLTDENTVNDAMRLAFRIFGEEEEPISQDDVKSLLYCIGSPRLTKEELADLTDAANAL